MSYLSHFNQLIIWNINELKLNSFYTINYLIVDQLLFNDNFLEPQTEEKLKGIISEYEYYINEIKYNLRKYKEQIEEEFEEY